MDTREHLKSVFQAHDIAIRNEILPTIPVPDHGRASPDDVIRAVKSYTIRHQIKFPYTRWARLVHDLLDALEPKENES